MAALDSCLRDMRASVHNIAPDWFRQNVLTTKIIVIHMVEGVCAFDRELNQREHDQLCLVQTVILVRF